VDPVSSHTKWAADIEETQGHKVKYPMIGDPEMKEIVPPVVETWKRKQPPSARTRIELGMRTLISERRAAMAERGQTRLCVSFGRIESPSESMDL